MKRIVNYKTFINESAGASTLTPEQIEFLDDHVKRKWKLNADGVVDVDGDFNCLNKGISDFKGIVFGKVGGYFDCSYNKLTSLEGCPKEVGGDFYCHYNNLTSLEDCPKEVGEGFYCSYNNLTSLEGCPKEVGEDFNCSYNNLTSLEGCPEKVNGEFDCSYNNLTSLEGSPKEVGGEFYFDYSEGASSETLKLIFSKMIEYQLLYSDVLKSLWKEIPIEDKVLLYTPDLDWVEEDEASKLVKLKKYSNIKKMI